MCFNEATFLFTCSVLLSHSACSPLTQVGGGVIFKQDVFSFLTSSVKMGLNSNNSWLEQNSAVMLKALKSWQEGVCSALLFLLFSPE